MCTFQKPIFSHSVRGMLPSASECLVSRLSSTWNEPYGSRRFTRRREVMYDTTVIKAVMIDIMRNQGMVASVVVVGLA